MRAWCVLENVSSRHKHASQSTPLASTIPSMSLASQTSLTNSLPCQNPASALEVYIVHADDNLTKECQASSHSQHMFARADSQIASVLCNVQAECKCSWECVEGLNVASGV